MKRIMTNPIASAVVCLLLASAFSMLLISIWTSSNNIYSNNNHGTRLGCSGVPPPYYEVVATVEDVCDGDTIAVWIVDNVVWLDPEGHVGEYDWSSYGHYKDGWERVRFGGGIDAPEWNAEGGSEATEFIRNLIPPGTTVYLDLDNLAVGGQTGWPYRGYWDRLIAVIYAVIDGQWVNINAELLRWGMEAYPGNYWDEYAGIESEFNLYDWPPYDNDYPYVLDHSAYYNGTEGKTGTALKLALHDIIKGHTEVDYTSLWTHFQTTDNKPNGKVWDMYSDNPGGTPPYEFTFVDDQCEGYSEEGDCYNREHSWPRSWFDGEVPPMNTDLFLVYPTDGYVNGKRGSYPYGEVSSPTWASLNGSKVGPSSYPGYSGTVFEPIDEYKGDFARTYFYMSVRYYTEDSEWPGSGMVDGAELKPWAENMLKEWHADDPVSQKEIDRNDAVYGIQNNRNPFIDHPGWVYDIWGGGPTSAPSAPTLLSPSDGVVTSDNAPTFEWTNGSGADEHKLLVDNDTDFSSPEIDVTLAVPENTYTPTTGLADDNYSWRVWAIDNVENENASSVWTFIIDTTPPSAPTPSSPADNSATSDPTPTFSWSSVSDPSGVTYKLQIDNESTFSAPLVFENAGIPDNTYALPEENALADGAYHWRVWLVDNVGNENMSEVWRFTVDTVAPAALTLLAPETGATVTTRTPTFNWSDVSDPSGGTYRIQVDASPADWASCAIDVSDLTPSSYTPTTGLADGSYEWRALAVDGTGNASDWSSTWLLTISQLSSTLTIDLVSFTIQPENSITITAVLTSNDTPLAGKLITWTTMVGGVSPGSGTTDAQGKVSATYTAPDIETAITVTASFAGDENYLGGSGNSSGTIETAPLKLTLAATFIPAGENHVFKFEDYPVPVFKVTITVENDAEDAEVTVEMLENVEVPVPPGMVHYYTNITTNITHANVRGLLTRFRVSKSWVALNDIDKGTIKVLKFDEVENEWRELSTSFVDEDSTYLYFETSMEGLSLFAITGGKAAAIPILLIALAVAAASAGGIGVAVLWVRSKRRPSRLKRARRAPKRRKKGKKRAP